MLKKTLTRLCILIAIFLQVAFIPSIGFADSNVPSATPGLEEQRGPQSPPGDASKTYTFNEATGLWENDYYTWNPKTGQTAPKSPQKYSYNPETKTWDTVEWRYDAPSGAYVPNKIAVPRGEVPASAIPAVADPEKLEGSSAKSSSAPSSLESDKESGGAYDLFYNAAISNSIRSSAVSGDASVVKNTLGGNATSGDALASATVITLLQSVWSPTNGEVTSFTTDINDWNGDLVIDPSQYSPTALSSSSDQESMALNVASDTTITNDITLRAASGDATVSGNSSAGDATSGDAVAIANVVNMMNSIIASGNSFVGTINIRGNLNGDILLPEDILRNVLASNVPRTTVDMNEATVGNITAAFNDQTTIKNNVQATADSGTATVIGNTTAGNATSGNASTSVTVLNLTGRSIVGSNALLVFVNVMGSWVGMLMDAPAGSTAAAIGGGITTDNSNIPGSINSASQLGIENNVSVHAASGNAEVSGNTLGGNASSGNAQAAVSIANVSNSTVALSDWFGVLFINVFGNWLGSFGINTSAGDPITPNQPATPRDNTPVFQYIPTTTTRNARPAPNTAASTAPATPVDEQEYSSPTPASSLGTTVPPLPPSTPAVTTLSKLSPLLRAYGGLLAVGVTVVACKSYLTRSRPSRYILRRS